MFGAKIAARLSSESDHVSGFDADPIGRGAAIPAPRRQARKECYPAGAKDDDATELRRVIVGDADALRLHARRDLGPSREDRRFNDWGKQHGLISH
jgi:hypothetical protein